MPLPRSWSFAWGAGGLVLGFLIGAGLTATVLISRFRPVSQMLLASPYATAASATSLDTNVLTRLRSGAVEEADALLEDDLDGHLFTLGSYQTIPAEYRQDAIYRVLARAAAYRREHPRPAGAKPLSPEVDAQVAKALALGQQAAPNHHSGDP